MISKRLRYSNDSWIPLNDIQVQAKLDVEKKLSQKHYTMEEVDCIVCGSRNFKLLATKDRYGLRVSTVICKRCGLVQSNPRMTEAAYKEFYDKEYRRLYLGVDFPQQPYFDRQISHGKEIIAYLQGQGLIGTDLRHMVVLEVGCAAGGILYSFKQAGAEVLGIDLGSEYLHYGRENYGLNLFQGDVSSISSDIQADLVIYSHVIEHISNPTVELNTVSRLLKPTGILYIEVPGLLNLHNEYNQDILRYLQNAHLYHFTLSSLINLLSLSGFKIITGDETIYATFQKNNDFKGKRCLQYGNCKNTVRYLKKTERSFEDSNHQPGKWARMVHTGLKRQTIRCLRVLGVYNWLKRIISSK